MFIHSTAPTGRTEYIAMAFECQRCGTCCSTMGEIISIREQIHPYGFRIAFITGEERVVSVDPDKRELFDTNRQHEKRSLSCPFLRQKGPSLRICTVHASRPDLCRGYLCSRILVLDPAGKKAGRVPYGTRSFIPEDGAILDLWSRAMQDTQIPDDEQWEEFVEAVFRKGGYRVIR